MNDSTPAVTTHDSLRAERDRLWHELRESQAREASLADAAFDLLAAMAADSGGGLPERTLQMRDQLVALLPPDHRSRLVKPAAFDDNDEGSRMDKTAKFMVYVVVPALIGIVAWAYWVTPMAS